jgi:hypothetical protein
MYALSSRNEIDAIKLYSDIEMDCKDSFKKIPHKLKKDQIKMYCEEFLKLNVVTGEKDMALFRFFPELPQAHRDLLSLEFQLKYIPQGLDKYRKYETERLTLFSEFDSEIDRHKNEVRNLKDRMDLDPEIALSELEAINKFVEKLMKEQSLLYTKGLRSQKLKIEEVCMEVTGASPPEDKELKKLYEAQKVAEELDGSKVGNTSIHCSPGLSRVECAQKLQEIQTVLKGKPTTIPRIVIVPGDTTFMKSVLFKTGNPNLNFLQISALTDNEDLSEIIEKREASHRSE